MNISILCPTRQRPIQFQMMMDSLFEHTINKQDIEIHVTIDNDDNVAMEAFEKVQNKYPKENIILHRRKRGNSLVSHYFNWMCQFAKGKYILLINDDCLFRTYAWDFGVYNRLEEFLKDKPDGIVLGTIRDNLIYEENRQIEPYLIGIFPLLSKKAYEVMGYFLDPHYFSSTSDWDICRLYGSIGRQVDLRNICFIEHNPPEFYPYKNVNIWRDAIWEEIAEQIPCKIIDGIDSRKEILLNYINSFK